jgi:coenzyme F420-reducing hydrogenase alpha subunit
MSKTIKVDALTRVEGEGGIHIRFRGDKPVSVELCIFEPPRLFEAMLVGRPLEEAPDLTARICGICPVAYQMSSCQALEAALGVVPSEPIRRLRRLLYCGEWVQSHVLHMFMLHAPDYLGYPSFFEMSVDHPALVQDALAVKQAGNDLMRLLGGREVHPVSMAVGGFHRVPTRESLLVLLPELERSLEKMMRLTPHLADFDVHAFDRDYTWVALRHPEQYPMAEGRLSSNRGLDAPVDAFPRHFQETQVERSTALHCTLDGQSYLCGPLARINLNFDRLGSPARETARRAGFEVPYRNPFGLLVARGIEVVQALSEAIELIAGYEAPDEPREPIRHRAGVGAGCTEAPRGILFHQYEVDDEGIIRSARIVPPTSQNQRAIEEDLWELAPALADLPPDRARRLAEQAVRNHDPCISCATHAVQLDFESA